MRMLLSFLVSTVAFLLRETSAIPVKFSVAQEKGNSTIWMPSDYYDASVQILLLRSSGTEYYWQMYQGPSEVAVQPCGYTDPFKFADNKGVYHYGRDAIDNPPHTPAMDLELLEWMGHDDCVWRTHGNGDVGEVICGDWLVMPCEKDAFYNQGVINCHGRSFHRMYTCRY